MVLLTFLGLSRPAAAQIQPLAGAVGAVVAGQRNAIGGAPIEAGDEQPLPAAELGAGRWAPEGSQRRSLRFSPRSPSAGPRLPTPRPSW
jgi:hypothetical protein